MSQALERLLPDLCRHLSCDGAQFKDNDDHNGKIKVETEIDHFSPYCEETRNSNEKERCDTGKSNKNRIRGGFTDLQQDGNSWAHTGHSACVPNSTNSSATRWRRCVELWRHLLGSDRLFLALLFHSGSLWATEWSPSEKTPSNLSTVTTTESGRCCSWSGSLMWFLQIREGSSTGANSSHDGGVDDVNCVAAEGTQFTLHIYADDEVEVQRVAMGLLSDWFTIVDNCGPRFARAYYFSCALKVAALVGNTTLIENIPHLHDLVTREPRSASQFSAFCSILSCLLVEEARYFNSFWLQLPPPFFLLNFNEIGRGSRIGVWLSREAADVTSRKRRVVAGKNATNVFGGATATPNGEFHSCDVCSPGVILCTSSPSSSVCDATGDFMLCVQLLDEAYVRAVEVLPLLDDVGGFFALSQERVDVGEEKRRLCGRRSASFVAGSGQSAPRCWFSFSPATQSYVRVDLLLPRSLYAVVPPASSSTTTGSGGRRRNLQQLHEANLNLMPLRQSSRVTAQRDPLATIVIFLATTARRVIGCRGLFMRQQSQASFSDTDKNANNKNNDTNNTNNQSSTTNSGRCSSLTLFFTAEEELECLVECALQLFLEALLLCLTLSSDVMLQLDEWIVEVVSNTVDVAIATTRPVVRYMRSAGYALCIAPQPHQSLLVMVGLFATLAKRQLESKKKSNQKSKKTAQENTIVDDSDGCFIGWWDVFKTCVLEDAVMPGQLCGETWKLVERVERSLSVAAHVRFQRQQRLTQLPATPQELHESGDEKILTTANVTVSNEIADDGENASEVTLCEGKRSSSHFLPLRLRNRRERKAPASPCGNESQDQLVCIRAARVVKMESQQAEEQQLRYMLSFRNVVMNFWWSLRQAASDFM